MKKGLRERGSVASGYARLDKRVATSSTASLGQVGVAEYREQEQQAGMRRVDARSLLVGRAGDVRELLRVKRSFGFLEGLDAFGDLEVHQAVDEALLVGDSERAAAADEGPDAGG
ncbi:hypothetical protein ABT187_36970 [Streptomyces sp. NPDC001817]|uniref:hypothetical protein n=1 Tax=Streptomyces sp. NPDC001817 TaxID=3154398 RepID=UPI003329EE1F